VTSQANPRRKLHPALKALVAVAVAALVGVLIVWTARDSRAEPYEIAAGQLSNWALAVDTAGVNDTLVSLQPAPELTMNLFRQLFSRQMESMASATELGVALALDHEMPAGVTADEVMALAREVGLDRATIVPKCVGYRRVAQRGATRQLYFLWVDLPGFDRFRQALSARTGGHVDAAGLSPVLMMAAEGGFGGWHPVLVDEVRDCVAPAIAK
jgi:hypothetical protein